MVALERAAEGALRPHESVVDDGWTLRADGAHGVVRRANAVLPRGPGRDPLTAKVARVEDFYRARGRAPRFLLAPDAEPDGLVAALAVAGYRFEVPVLVLAKVLGPVAGLPVHDVACTTVPNVNWCSAYAATLPERERGERLRLALDAPDPKIYASVGADGCGLAVRSGDLVGLFDVATAPGVRRRGVARAVTAALLAWGAAAGARSAYLQVAEGNVPALALYASFGFRAAYRYVYAVPPADAEPIQ